MRRRETTLTQKGQVTIPREIRSRLGLKPRDWVAFELEGDVAVVRPAKPRVLKAYGAVGPKKRPEDFRVLRAEFEKSVAGEVASEG